MIDQQIAIPTRNGHTATFISHPERGGPFPVILFYMLLAAAAVLGGCAGGGGSAANSYAMAPSGGSGATVTFESIDGPPPQVFDRMGGRSSRHIATEKAKDRKSVV